MYILAADIFANIIGLFSMNRAVFHRNTITMVHLLDVTSEKGANNQFNLSDLFKAFGWIESSHN